jgi:hypothetical protein
MFRVFVSSLNCCISSSLFVSRAVSSWIALFVFWENSTNSASREARFVFTVDNDFSFGDFGELV